LCCFSTTTTKGKRIYRYDSVRKLLDDPRLCIYNTKEVKIVNTKTTQNVHMYTSLDTDKDCDLLQG